MEDWRDRNRVKEIDMEVEEKWGKVRRRKKG